MQEIANDAPGVNIYDTVLELRQHRSLMVQTEEQYIYLHDCTVQLIRELMQKRNAATNQGMHLPLPMPLPMICSVRMVQLLE